MLFGINLFLEFTDELLAILPWRPSESKQAKSNAFVSFIFEFKSINVGLFSSIDLFSIAFLNFNVNVC